MNFPTSLFFRRSSSRISTLNEPEKRRIEAVDDTISMSETETNGQSHTAEKNGVSLEQIDSISVKPPSNGSEHNARLSGTPEENGARASRHASKANHLGDDASRPSHSITDEKRSLRSQDRDSMGRRQLIFDFDNMNYSESLR